MGFMAEVMILMDNWHRLRENPEELTKAIQEGLREHQGADTYSAHGNSVQVMRSHHADEYRITFSHRNSFMQFDAYNLKRLDEQGWFKNAEFRVGLMEQNARMVAFELLRFRRALKEIRKKYPKSRRRK